MLANGYNLASGGQLTFTVNATVATTATCGSTVNNTATADFSATDNFSDINPVDNSATASFTVACPQVIVRKVSQAGATGTFGFSGDNGIQNHTVTTATAGTGVDGATQTLTAAGAATTITEAAPAAGIVLAGISCSGMGAGGIATPTLAGNAGGSVLLDAAATNTAGPITCTFTNRRVQADLSVTKSNTYTPAQPSDLANDAVARGAATTYTLVVTNAGPDAVTGTVVKDAPGTGLTCPAGNTVAIDYSGATADTSSTIGALTGASGIVLGALAANETATLTFTCTVN